MLDGNFQLSAFIPRPTSDTHQYLSSVSNIWKMVREYWGHNFTHMDPKDVRSVL
jgi:hypothetical protein